MGFGRVKKKSKNRSEVGAKTVSSAEEKWPKSFGNMYVCMISALSKKIEKSVKIGSHFGSKIDAKIKKKSIWPAEDAPSGDFECFFGLFERHQIFDEFWVGERGPKKSKKNTKRRKPGVSGATFARVGR